MNTKEDYIGVFDSGVGGISVLRHLRTIMPRERFWYFGDSANAPYGTRPTEQIRQLTLAAAEHLMSRGLKALVVACNTATAAAIGELRERYPDTIIIGIEPAIKPACDRFPGQTVGIMATPATLREEKLARLMDQCASCCHVIKLPAVGLVELVEAGKGNSEEAYELLKKLLGPLRGELKALVLGCTHYPFAGRAVARVLGEDTVLLDGGIGTAIHTMHRLEQAGLMYDGPGEVIFENSRNDPAMTELCRRLLTEDGI
jgi:glutamate racemase